MRFNVWVLLILSLVVVAGCLQPPANVKCEERAQLADRDDCFAEKAQKEGDRLLCDKIEGSIAQDACVAAFAIADQDFLNCQSLNEQTRNFCVAKIAIKQGSFSLCNNLSSPYWSDICNHDIAVNLLNFTYCLKVSHPIDRDACYRTIAERSLDSQACDYVKNDTKRDRCIISIAEDTLNVSLCASTESVILGDVCMLTIAKLTKNTTICNEISFPSIQHGCERELQNLSTEAIS